MTLLSSLSVRERLLLLGGAAVIGGMAAWLYVWQPLVSERTRQEARIARYLAVIDVAARAEDTPVVPATPAPPAPGDRPPLTPRVIASAEAAGIALARLDPQGAALRIVVAETDYDRAIQWIAALEEDSGIRATAAEMSRLTAPGRVSLSLTLEDAP